MDLFVGCILFSFSKHIDWYIEACLYHSFHPEANQHLLGKLCRSSVWNYWARINCGDVQCYCILPVVLTSQIHAVLVFGCTFRSFFNLLIKYMKSLILPLLYLIKSSFNMSLLTLLNFWNFSFPTVTCGCWTVRVLKVLSVGCTHTLVLCLWTMKTKQEKGRLWIISLWTVQTVSYQLPFSGYILKNK